MLLYWASPLNNPTNDRQRWTDAANAAWALIDKRYRLIDDYGDVFLSWNDEVDSHVPPQATLRLSSLLGRAAAVTTARV